MFTFKMHQSTLSCDVTQVLISPYDPDTPPALCNIHMVPIPTTSEEKRSLSAGIFHYTLFVFLTTPEPDVEEI